MRAADMRSNFLVQKTISVLIFGITLVTVMYRVSKNVDLSDESYYALFSYFWLKHGLAMSPLRDVHASAAILTYPLVRLFVQLQHSDRGLILLLRCLYVVGSLFSSVSIVILFKSWGRGTTAWLAGSLALIFIPFGLPAPSYNTLGLQGEMFGIAWFGIALLRLERGNKGVLALLLSACGFTLGALAYPTLFVPVPILIGAGAFAFPHLKRQLFLYGVFTLGLLVSGWAIVIWALTWSAVSETLAIQQHAVGLGLLVKMARSVALLTGAFHFAFLCVVAVLIGLCRPWLGSVAAAVSMALVLLTLCCLPSTLFIRSHDAVFLASLMGLGTLTGLLRSRPLEQRLEAVLYAGALCGGLVTMLTTSNPALLNFAVGGAPAAILAVLPQRNGPSSRGPFGTRLLAQSGGAVMLALVGWVSFFFRYGDLPTDTGEAQRRLTAGAFAGLSVSTDQASLIDTASAMLSPPGASTQTLAVFGRLSGLYLTSPALPTALRGFYLETTSSERIVHDIHGFYAAKRPDMVAIFDDPYLPVINPMLPEFTDDYAEVSRQQTPTGHITLYRRTTDRR